MSFQPNRVPRGVPEAGQFAEGKQSESAGISLASSRDPWSERLSELEGEGYVPAISSPSKASSTEISRRDFWRQAHVTAEYADRKGGYAQMGEKESRRLMTYSGGGVSVKMPSRSSVRAFARSEGQTTIDIPVTVDHDGRSVTGWVRATPGPDGGWETQALGFHDAHADTVAESVSAVLESRRPRTALSDAGNLAERRAQRRARTRGIQISEIQNSSALTAMGHDGTDVMAVKFHDYYRQRDQQWVTSKVYGYRTPPEVADSIRAAASPGKALAPVKKEAQPVPLERCTQCRRYYEAGRQHACARSIEANRRKDVQNTEHRSTAAQSLRSRLGSRS